MKRLIVLMAGAAPLIAGGWLAVARYGAQDRGAGRTAAPAGRVVLLSVDGGADWIVDRLLAEGRAPRLAAIARDGSQARALIGAMPTLTAAAHATLWTGASSREHGVTGNWVSPLPRREHTVLETRSGFDSTVLTAEPIWATAARAGRRALVIQATGGYPFTGGPSDRLLQFDVYANELRGDGVVTGSLARGPHPFMLGDTRFELVARPNGTVAIRSGGADAVLEPGPGGRFSRPLPIRVGAAEAALRFRLLSYDRGGAFRLYHGEAMRITSNDPAVLDEFRSRAGAIIGEGFVDEYRNGAFGPTLATGGTGEAERWFGHFVATNQEYFEGALEFAATREWDLLVAYLPNFDAVAHALVGMVDTTSATGDGRLSDRIWAILVDLFEMVVDRYLSRIRQLFPDATLVVTSDHGMEGTARTVLPNVALRQAGLLAVDTGGRPDLARTQAVFVQGKGHMIFVNSTDWRDGIVPPAERDAIKARIAAVLLSIRDPDTGQAVIRAVFDPALDGDGLMIGGESAGDLYFEPAFNYSTRDRATGDEPVVRQGPTGSGTHGAAPWRRNLHAILYIAGSGVARGRDLGVVRSIDVAPTVSMLLGIPPPAQAIGRALPVRP